VLFKPAPRCVHLANVAVASATGSVPHQLVLERFSFHFQVKPQQVQRIILQELWQVVDVIGLDKAQPRITGGRSAANAQQRDSQEFSNRFTDIFRTTAHIAPALIIPSSAGRRTGGRLRTWQDDYVNRLVQFDRRADAVMTVTDTSKRIHFNRSEPLYTALKER
jgi:hypothetical protein